MNQLKIITFLTVVFSATLFCQTTDYNKPQKLIRDNDINSNEHIIFHKDTVYVLSDNVFVEEGATLEIEAGTVIKGLQGSLQEGRNVASLIICRGAHIIAEGTKDEPIIFTEYSDSVEVPSMNYFQDFYSVWGGLFILGKAEINNLNNFGSIDYIVGNQDGKELYGGNENADSSGVLRFVSIRYAGWHEHAGLFLSGVGRKTILYKIELIQCRDLGLRIDNCTVNISNISIAMTSATMFDLIGFRGNIQFMFILDKQEELNAGGLFHNSYSYYEVTEPTNYFKIYNSTQISTGNYPNFDFNESFLVFQNNSQGEFKNNMIIETDNIPLGVFEECRTNLEENKLTIGNNLFWLNEEYLTFESMQIQDFVIDHLDSNNNIIADPLLYGISRTNDGGLDPRPRPESPAWTMELADYPDDGFFEPVNYAGAFGTENWLEGWSWLWQMGYFDTTATSISKPDEPIPVEYKLEQNYPNPFNPKSKIKFQIENSGYVELVVYDLLGNEITKLVNEYKPAGSYDIVFDGSNLSSGVYFYNLKSGNYIETKKMVLLR